MSTYIVISNFTDQGIRNIKETTNRADTVRETAKKFGVTVKEIYWTLGAYDVVALFDAPDEAAITTLALSLGAAGNVRTQVMRAFTQQEMRGVISRITQERVPAHA